MVISLLWATSLILYFVIFLFKIKVKANVSVALDKQMATIVSDNAEDGSDNTCTDTIVPNLTPLKQMVNLQAVHAYTR